MGILQGISLLLSISCIHVAYGIDGLYVSNSTHILFQRQNNLQSSNLPTSVYSKENSRIVGLAVDVEDNLVFWSDIGFSNFGIYKGAISGNGSLENVEKIVTDVTEVNGLAVDWKRDLLYWTDCSRHSVEVARYDGSGRVVLTIDNLQTPRGIALDLENGYLFWNDQGTGKIERSWLDGSNREEFVSSGVEWPNQMAVRDGNLYCVDAKTLNVMQYKTDGSGQTSLGSAAPFGANVDTRHPYGLAVDQYYVYVSIWYNTQSVVRFAINNINEHSNVLGTLGIEPIFSLAFFSTDNQPAVSSDPCAGKSCDGICLPKDSTYRCTCSTFGGQTLQSDEVSCSAPTNVMFYVLAEEGIVAYRDIDGAATPDRSIVGRSPRPVAVGYDPVEQMVYWSDVTERTIHKASLDGSSNTVFMSSSSHSLGTVDGLALDPVGRKLYYSHMGSVDVYEDSYSWSRIEFIGLDGMGRKTIVEDVDMPRGMYLDSENGHLYYTDWGSQPSVVQVNLDGSDRKVIHIAGLDNPNAITMLDSKLYVIDSHYKTRDSDLNPNYPGPAKDGALYSVNTDGTGWTEESLTDLKTPFGLTSYDGKLYISDWDKKAIFQFIPGNSATTYIDDLNEPMALFYSPATMTKETDACSSAGCGEVCVVSDGSSECLCDSYTPSILSSGTCATPDYFMLVADFNAVKLIDLSVSKTSTEVVREPQVLIEGSGYFSNFVSLAYDEDTKILYYSDVNRQTIYHTSLDDPETRSVLIETEDVVDGMDLHENKLYWTASEKGNIYSTDITTNVTTLLVSGLSQPRAIKVRGNDIYWTEWGKTPRVMKATETDWSNMEVLVEGLVRPNGLDVDLTHLYIGESSDTPRLIKCPLSDLQSCIDITVTGDIKPQQIFSIKKDANRIYYTDWQAGTLSLLILGTDKTQGEVVHLAENLMRPTEIITKTGSAQPCPDPNDCSDTCLPYFGGYICSCPDNEYLQPDRKTCNTAAEIGQQIGPCTYNGNTYQVGDSFEPNDCTSCICEVDRTFGNPEYGGATCRVMACPVLICEEEQQEQIDGECCRSCKKSDCETTPVSIVECPDRKLSVTLTLGRSQAVYENYQFVLTGRDNCDIYQSVDVTVPGQNRFPWKRDDYELEAIATSSTNSDSYKCSISLTVEDVTPPTVNCPPDQTIYYTTDVYCVARPTWVLDNVCGTSGQEECLVTGEDCQKFGPDQSHTVTYTAKDQAGNEASCSFSVNVVEVQTSCDLFNVNSGRVECTSAGCTIICDPGTTSQLINGITEYSCQSNGSYTPKLPQNIAILACTKVSKKKLILFDRLKDLPCPLYFELVVAGLQSTITTSYLSDHFRNPLKLLMEVRVTGTGCNSKKRSSDDFAMSIRLSTEVDIDKDEKDIEDALTNMMDGIREDIIGGILLTYNEGDDDMITNDNFEGRTEVVLDCDSGEIIEDDDCIQCPIGTRKRNSVCELCPMNEYNDKVASTNCKVCPGGKVTEEPGSSSRSQCFDRVNDDDETTPFEIADSSQLAVIIGAVVAAVVLAAVVIVILICCKRMRNNGDPKKDPEKHFDNPAFKEEGVYEEPPEIKDPQYQGLSYKKGQEDNPYNNLTKDTNGSSNGSENYLEPQ